MLNWLTLEKAAQWLQRKGAIEVQGAEEILQLVIARELQISVAFPNRVAAKKVEFFSSDKRVSELYPAGEWGIGLLEQPIYLAGLARMWGLNENVKARTVGDMLWLEGIFDLLLIGSEFDYILQCHNSIAGWAERKPRFGGGAFFVDFQEGQQQVYLLQHQSEGLLPNGERYRYLPAGYWQLRNYFPDVAHPEWGQLVVRMEMLEVYWQKREARGEGQASASESDAPGNPILPIACEIPGKEFNVSSRRLAVKAAWEIECETGRAATDKATMERLQLWADAGKEPDVLLRSDRPNRAVKWLTTSRGERDFDIDACRKTLAEWMKSRE